jgi:hypothetical protein
VLSPPFPLPSAASPLADVTTLPPYVMLPSHGAKTSLLPSLHLFAMLHPVASPLKPKLKHWIRTTTTGHPPQTARLPPSTAIKRSSQPWQLSTPLYRIFILPPPQPEHHTIGAPPIVVAPFHYSPTSIVPPHNDTHSDELADPLSLPKQHIGMWIHVKRYIEIL